MEEEEHGKTSSAKILARAINCLNPHDGEPCNKCEICEGILAGSLTDVVEMDAASNNSVEDIRQIRDEINFLPTLAKYRVYIIDEVHMLSTGAFNALLKTLEEPPEHVKFILATTEPQKLPPTILSRCQRFDFKQLSNEDIIKRLKVICDESKIEITKEALNTIAVLSEGAARDAISILERCLQDGETKISEDKIKELVGIPKTDVLNEITKYIIENDAIRALDLVGRVINEGKDLNNFLWEIIKYIKDVLVYKTTNELQIYSNDDIEKIKEIVGDVSSERLLNLIYSLSELENNIKWSSQKNIMFQAGIIKACSKQENNGIKELEARITKLENMLGDAKNASIEIKNEEKTDNKPKVAKPKEPVKIGVIPSKEKEQEPTNIQKEEIKIACKPESIGKYIECWTDIINELKQSGKPLMYTQLLGTRARQVNENLVEVEFPKKITGFAKSVIELQENKKELMGIISKEIGKEIQVKYIEKEETKETKEENPVGLEGLDIPINIIE